MSNSLAYDWKKAAATVMEDDAVERAFMDQSYTFIQNKAGKLMQDPYRLGFELVAKNDDSTRMIGIYGFRVNAELLYAPVFFLSGEIKGTDLLYRTKTKSFIPLNEEWVNFIIEKSDMREGQGISRQISRRSPANLQLQRLASPMSTFKMASENGKEAQAWFDGVAKEAKCFTGDENPKVLREFLLEAGPAMFAKLASHMEREYSLANALVTTCDEADYMPPELIENIKSASAAARKVTLRLTNEMEPGLRMDDFCKRGFQIIDERPLDVKSTVYEDKDTALASIGSPGLCSVLTKDGNRVDVLVFLDTDNGSLKCCTPDYEPNSNTLYGTGVLTEDMDDFKKGTIIRIRGQAIYGDVKKQVKELEESSDLKKSMETGKLYLVVNLEKGTASDAVYCLGKTDDDGVVSYKYATNYGRVKVLTHNEDYAESDNANDVFGRGTRFIELAKKERSSSGLDAPCGESGDRVDNVPDTVSVYAGDILGNGATVMNWILKSGAVDPLTVRVDDIGDFSVILGDLEVTGGTKKQAAAGLAKVLRIDGAAAEDIVDAAAAKGSVSYFLEMSKSAGAIRIQQEPEFRESFNSMFRTPEESPQGFALSTTSDQDPVNESRIGDAYDPNAGGYNPDDDSGISMEQLMSRSPEELAQVAKTIKSPGVFEHGVIGSLASTYDASALMDTYIGKMQGALDALGRSLFLFYWKPKDFEESYGVDDMQNMEQKLLSSFKQFGELVLDLSKKANKNKLKSVSVDRN